MPEISRFFGIRILMFYNDHTPPHFHAEYSGERVSIEIESLAVMEGSLRRRALGMVIEWAGGHRGELLEDWRRARMGLPLLEIRPLE
jgi:hypothetical protein